MVCSYPIRVYKNEDITLTIPMDFEGEPNEFYLHVYTYNNTYVDIPYSAITVEEGVGTVVIESGGLDPLNDGVIRYELAYSEGDNDYVENRNTNMVLKTPNGYSGRTCDEMWEDGYQSGYTDGQGSQCDCSEAYQSGITEGIRQQKAKLTTLNANTNMTYERTDGYNRVVVNVPTGYSQSDLDNAYDSGYTAGLNDCSGETPDCTDAWNSGYTSGYTDGLNECTGYTQADLDAAFQSGWTGGYNSGYTNGYNDGQYEYSGSTDYKDQYLTFEILSGGTLGWGPQTSNTKWIEYSLNGSAWQTLRNSVQLNAGDKIRFRGDNSCYYESGSQSTYTWTWSTGLKYNVYGNIMSLISSTGFRTATTLTEARTFKKMFYNQPIVSAKYLILPATTLSQACYMEMFSETGLIEAPEVLPALSLSPWCYYKMFQSSHNFQTAPILPAIVLNEESYADMFYHCSSLNYIRCLAIDISANSCVNDWVMGVASSGTFEKNPSMTGWTTGTNGIPDSWTVVDAS